MNAGAIFREASIQLEEQFANTYCGLDEEGNPTELQFKARLETKPYKDYVRRILKATGEVGFLQAGQTIINVLDPENRMKVEGREKHYINGCFIYWIIYLSSGAEDPLTRIVRNL